MNDRLVDRFIARSSDGVEVEILVYESIRPAGHRGNPGATAPGGKYARTTAGAHAQPAEDGGGELWVLPLDSAHCSRVFKRTR